MHVHQDTLCTHALMSGQQIRHPHRQCYWNTITLGMSTTSTNFSLVAKRNYGAKQNLLRSSAADPSATNHPAMNTAGSPTQEGTQQYEPIVMASTISDSLTIHIAYSCESSNAGFARLVMLDVTMTTESLRNSMINTKLTHKLCIVWLLQMLLVVEDH